METSHSAFDDIVRIYILLTYLVTIRKIEEKNNEKQEA